MKDLALFYYDTLIYLSLDNEIKSLFITLQLYHASSLISNKLIV